MIAHFSFFVRLQKFNFLLRQRILILNFPFEADLFLASLFSALFSLLNFPYLSAFSKLKFKLLDFDRLINLLIDGVMGTGQVNSGVTAAIIYISGDFCLFPSHNAIGNITISTHYILPMTGTPFNVTSCFIFGDQISSQ